MTTPPTGPAPTLPPATLITAPLTALTFCLTPCPQGTANNPESENEHPIDIMLPPLGFIFSTSSPACPPASSTPCPQHGGKDLATLNQFLLLKHCKSENENCDLNDTSSWCFQEDKLA
ncbi:hypothetical protein FQN55_003178 [Onygenales sp. PD_40]|nr:hypothetical protein FQN55_003178 [Onygenales sp. PD_40]